MITGAAPSHVNNFTLLRIAAAVAVLVTHCYDLQRLEDIAYRSTGFRFGVWAVDVFFVISGYLVLTSFERRKDVVAFVRARALRILPGLWVMLIVTTIILGLFFSTLPASSFFADFRTLKYLACNMVIGPYCYVLPGVFDSNPVGNHVNGQLWTLKYEVLCYTMLGVAGALGLLYSNARKTAVFGAIFIFYAVWIALNWNGPLSFIKASITGELNSLTHLLFCFLIGMIYATWPVKIRWWHVACAAMIFVLLMGTPLVTTALAVLIGVAVFWIAYLEPLTPIKLPDLSYGLYIYGGPIQQALISIIGSIDPLLFFLPSLVLTAIPAWFSWFYIEKPALRLKEVRPQARLGSTPAE
jgi:peptidoglycan/LPS O-acetylase OafA/YrhL